MNLEQNLGFFEENSFSNNDFINYGGITEVYAFMPRPPRGPKRIGGCGGFKGKIGNIPQYSYSKPFKSTFNPPVLPGSINLGSINKPPTISSKKLQKMIKALNTPQNFVLKSSKIGAGSMKIYIKPGNRQGDCLHTFPDGGAHIDIGSQHLKKLHITRLGSPSYIKNLRGVF